jgi:hypothetical protein
MSWKPIKVERERARLNKRPLSEDEQHPIVRQYNIDKRDVIRHEDEINQILIGME